MSQASDSLSFSGLLNGPQSFDLSDYDNVKSLVEYMDGNNEHFVSSNDNDVLLSTCTMYPMLKQENGLVDNLENYTPKQEVQEPQIEEPPLLPQPAAIPRVLSDEEYPGPLNFEVQLDPCGTKNPWVYSPLLRKIFIGINTSFPVDFKWTPIDKKLFVRATPTFSLSQHNQELVLRCVPHAQATDGSNTDIPPHIWDHIIRCNNMQAMYVGDKNRGVHLSVVVPLSNPQTGSETVREMFKFMCKNSCPSGMNRRPVQVLFTIEDENFEILGRRVLQVRICSCPKRDKEKAEKEFQKDAHKEPVLNGKKRKVDKPALDLQEYKLQVKVVGKNNYMKVVQYTADLMRSEAYLHGSTAEPAFKRALADLNNLLKAPDHSA